MNGKPCASPGIATCWEAIDWQKALAYVKKLQVRIVKAQKEGHYSKVKSLQWAADTFVLCQSLGSEASDK